MAECVKNDITSFEMLLKRLVIFIANIEQSSSFCILLRARMTKANNIGLDTFDDDDWSCHSLSQSPAHTGPINIKIVKNILIPPDINLFS